MKKTLLIILLVFNFSSIHALEIPDNPRVNHWVKEFTQNRRKFFQRSIIRSGLYRETVKKVFDLEGLPEDLSWVPFIESGFNCSADSTAKAAGCWQFIPKTGEAFGLKKGTWKDQRYDFNKSTKAAAKYLKRLYRRFKNWELVLAAYNCGPTKVRKAIKKSGKNYWDMSLPKETMEYIPEFYAVLKITRDLKKYGFNESSDSLKSVQLKEGVHSLRYIAKNILKVDYKEFARINPGYIIGYTPPGESTRIYLKEDWDVSLLKWFGLLAKKDSLN